MIRPFDERLPDTRTSPRRLPDVENGGGAFLVVTPSAFHLRPCPIARNVAAPAHLGRVSGRWRSAWRRPLVGMRSEPFLIGPGEMPCRWPTISAVAGMEWVPGACCMRGLTSRQPVVVS